MSEHWVESARSTRENFVVTKPPVLQARDDLALCNSSCEELLGDCVGGGRPSRARSFSEKVAGFSFTQPGSDDYSKFGGCEDEDDFYTRGIFSPEFIEFKRDQEGKYAEQEYFEDDEFEVDKRMYRFLLCCALRTEDATANGRKTSRYCADREEKITMDEVSLWKTCFENIMNSPQGRDQFGRFLRSEFSEENMQFWVACAELEALQDEREVTEKAVKIYEEFISTVSPKEVSIDSRIREITNQNMMHPTKATFKEAQNQIYQLMQRDSYHRFLNSQQFKELEKQATKS